MFARVAVVGVEILAVDARVVIASVDTYLRFAEAANRLDLGSGEAPGLPELVRSEVATDPRRHNHAMQGWWRPGAADGRC